MLKLFLPAMLALAVALSLATAASAKGPLTATIGAGGLSEPVVLDMTFGEQELYTQIAGEPLKTSVEGEEAYTLEFAFEEPGAEGGRHVAFTLEYFPATATHPPLIHDTDGEFLSKGMTFAAGEDLQQAIDESGVALSPEAGSDGAGLAWFFLPAALAGLVLLGGAGGIAMRRRNR